MLKREKSDFQQTSGPRRRSDSYYACHLSLRSAMSVYLILHLVPSAVGTCPASPPDCSFLVISYPLSLNSGLSSQRKCPVVPMMLQCRSSCKTLQAFFAPSPWHLHTILEFLSAQILASYFCSAESFGKAISMCLYPKPFTVTIVYQIICNKSKSEPKPRCAFADTGI